MQSELVWPERFALVRANGSLSHARIRSRTAGERRERTADEQMWGV